MLLVNRYLCEIYGYFGKPYPNVEKALSILDFCVLHDDIVLDPNGECIGYVEDFDLVAPDGSDPFDGLTFRNYDWRKI